MRRVVADLIPVQALHSRCRQSRGEERPLDRIGRFTGEVHFLEVVDQRAEEVRQAGPGRRHGQIHLCGEYLRPSFNMRGEVEVFDLTGHPKAKRCYGWSYGEPEEFITILELPPVDSAESAVKVGVAYQVKKARKEK